MPVTKQPESQLSAGVRSSSSSSNSAGPAATSAAALPPPSPASQPNGSTGAATLDSKLMKKKTSYGALRAASHTLSSSFSSSHSNASSGSNSGVNSVPPNGALSIARAPSPGGASGTSSLQGGSLPRAIPGSASSSYRIPLQDDGRLGVAGGGGSRRSSAKGSVGRSFSPGKGLGYLSDRQDSPSPIPQDEREVARLISEHLVDPDEDLIGVADGDALSSQGAEVFQTPISSTSHLSAPQAQANAAGSPQQSFGATTRDIYQWTEKRMQSENHRRRNSEPDLQALRRSPELVTASDLQQPGMFRRHFLTRRAHAQGRQPNIFTRNFIDFLVLYGFYGGDVYPETEDDEDDEAEDDRRPGMPSGMRDDEAPGGTGGASESTPLLRGGSQNVRSSAAVHGTSAKKAFFMLIKAFVGTGVLFLPKAFSNGGMGFSILLLVIIGGLTLHCMMLLVQTSRTLGGSFGDLGEKLYGNSMRQLVLWSIAVSQAGFACAYLIFVSQNLRDLTMIVSDCKWIFPDWVFLIVQLLIYIPLSWVRRIKHFSIPSLVADVFILMGLAYIFYHDITVLSTVGPAKDLVWINLESFSLFVGTAMFAFEGICLILPIAESMKQPEKFSLVLTLCVTTIAVIFIVIGAAGYLTFGSKVETVVFLNLPKGSGLVLSLQFFYAVAIMLSFPLTVYPSIRIIEAALFGVRDGKVSSLVKWEKNGFRALFVTMLAFVAWTGSNNLDKFVSLVGCLACIPLSFIYPSMFHYHIAKSSWERIKDIFLIIFGLIALFYTTYVTIQQWVVGSPDIPMDRCSITIGG
ncbi:neutral amino acid transporter [Irineochytrium annulatum]|nr:neutral amino acid transporter [Irineochytrium annulatum]